MGLSKLHGLVWILVFGLLTFLSLNKHSRSGTFNYHSEIWADKSGYYVYLPSTFNYSFRANSFPDSIDTKTGNGFKLDLERNKVLTKYTYGVALLQAPFYLLADFSAPLFAQKDDGFSAIYHVAVNVSAVFYFVLGLIMLIHVLTSIYNRETAIWTIILLFLGTNLYYYVIADTGMSHVYSFFLFSFLLFISKKTNFITHKTSVFTLILVGAIAGLLIVIRPTNVIGLAFLAVFQISNSNEFFTRLNSISRLQKLAPIFFGGILAVVPQLLYWNYVDGSLIKYSYENEGFNWLHPQIIKSWFSPNNGLFLYGSIWLFIIISFVFSSMKQKWMIVYPVLFLVISYISSSWWAWNFGCSYGGRNYVEYLAFFSVPFGFLLSKFTTWNKPIKIIFAFSSIVLIILNLHLIYAYDGCFYGTSDWDWFAYRNLIFSNIN